LQSAPSTSNPNCSKSPGSKLPRPMKRKSPSSGTSSTTSRPMTSKPELRTHESETVSLHTDPVLANREIAAAGNDNLRGLDDWREMDPKQQPTYLDSAALEEVLSDLRTSPPLVFAGEADVLKNRIASASRGEAFVLAGGDCAESFDGA